MKRAYSKVIEIPEDARVSTIPFLRNVYIELMKELYDEKVLDVYVAVRVRPYHEYDERREVHRYTCVADVIPIYNQECIVNIETKYVMEKIKMTFLQRLRYLFTNKMPKEVKLK